MTKSNYVIYSNEFLTGGAQDLPNLCLTNQMVWCSSLTLGPYLTRHRKSFSGLCLINTDLPKRCRRVAEHHGSLLAGPSPLTVSALLGSRSQQSRKWVRGKEREREEAGMQ